MENFELIKELVTEKDIYSEYEHLAIKVKNANKNIRADVKDLYDELKIQEVQEEEFIFEMAKLLTICEGILDFNKMSLEEFKQLIDKDNLLCEDFEDILNDVIIIMSRCIKHELQLAMILVNKQAVETLSLELQSDALAFYDSAIGSARNIKKLKDKQRDIKAQKQAIDKFDTSKWDDIPKWKLMWLERKLNKQAKKNKKVIEKENGKL